MIRVTIILFGFWLSASTQATELPNKPCYVDSAFKRLASDNNLLMFGELHGTQEMPAYVASVLCFLSTDIKPIKLGIEYLPDQLPYLIKYIDSSGTRQDKEALVFNPYWSAKYQDGRTSQAMFELVDQVRLLRKSGHDVSLFVFDNQLEQNRDKAMAEMVIAELSKDPDVFHMLITGNIHSQMKKGVPWNSSLETMGTYLSKLNTKITSVLLTHSGGEAWICTPDCKTTSLKESKTKTVMIGRLAVAHQNQKHDYQIKLGRITASLPAYQSQSR